MKISTNKRVFALLLSFVLLALCAGGALAAAPSAKASAGGYTLQKKEDSAGGVTLTYGGAGGQLTAHYTTGGMAAQRLGTRQFSTETLIYACYSDDFDSDSIGTVYYTVDGCTVTVRAAGGRVAKDEMLAFLEALQVGPVPVATCVCAKCGGEVYCHGAQVGAWQAGSDSVCSHGGTVKYKDTQNQRSVTVTSVCASCGDKTTQSYTQDAVYCNFTDHWYGQSVR